MITQGKAVVGITLLALGGCQTAPGADAGFLSGYDQMTPRKNSLRAAVRERRDEAAAVRSGSSSSRPPRSATRAPP